MYNGFGSDYTSLQNNILKLPQEGWWYFLVELDPLFSKKKSKKGRFKIF